MVAHAFAGRAGVRHQILHTGQHFDANMSDVFFRELRIPDPDFNLGVQSGRHGAMTGRMLEAIETLLMDEAPDLVIVYGDTNSTLAGALAAAKLEIPIAHVEAGMRSFSRMPEEINRVLTDHISDLHFTASEVSTRHLAREGLAGPRVHQVGDVMYDCALRSVAIAERQSNVLERLSLNTGDFVLCTVHRPVTADNPQKLRCLVDALVEVSRRMPVVLPVHPRTRAKLEAFGIRVDDEPALKLIDPVGYLDMVRLQRASAVVVTDSGGVQREAFFHEVPCVTFRDETEWTELVDAGWNVLAPLDDPHRLASLVLSRIGTRGAPVRPYGEGDAATRIADRIETYLRERG